MLWAMCGVQLKDRIRVNYLMLMLGINETIDQLAMANCVFIGMVMCTGGSIVIS